MAPKWEALRRSARKLSPCKGFVFFRGNRFVGTKEAMCCCNWPGSLRGSRIASVISQLAPVQGWTNGSADPHRARKNLSGDSRWPTCRPVGDGCSWTGLRLLLLPHPILIIVIIIIITVFAFASHFHLSGNEGKVGCSQCSISRVNLFARVALQEGNVELVGERYLTE